MDTVCLFIVSFVQVSNWLSEDIVFTENAEERVALVSRLVDIMEVHVQMFLVSHSFDSELIPGPVESEQFCWHVCH